MKKQSQAGHTSTVAHSTPGSITLGDHQADRRRSISAPPTVVPVDRSDQRRRRWRAMSERMLNDVAVLRHSPASPSKPLACTPQLQQPSISSYYGRGRPVFSYSWSTLMRMSSSQFKLHLVTGKRTWIIKWDTLSKPFISEL